MNTPLRIADAETDQITQAREEMRARLRRLLGPQRIRVLGLWLGGESAAGIARQVKRSRRTVRDWIAFALQRMEDANIPIPARSSPPAAAGREVYCEPAALDRLVRDGRDGVAKWLNAA